VTESDLIQQAQRGDPQAWESLTVSHQQAVFRLAYLLLGDPDEAEDAAQETLVRAYFSLKRFDPARPLRPWLLQIVSNLASNRRRSLGRYFQALTRFAREPAETHASIPQEDADLLWRAVRRMKFEFQQVIYLRYFLEMTEEEMSAALGTPPGTVKSRLHRALAALRQVISREFPELQEALIP
jgi:RNA polymerase sigma-70 factor (ECF subfamily)